MDIEAVEFYRETVKFVEAMYCGALDISRENFREVNKICHVFNFTWMSGIYLQYNYDQVFGSPETPDLITISEKDISFLFSEAMYFCEHGHSSSLLEIFRKKSLITLQGPS